MAGNVLRLCVCLPLAQAFNLPQMLMGQIAQNRCYKLVRFNSTELESKNETFFLFFFVRRENKN